MSQRIPGPHPFLRRQHVTGSDRAKVAPPDEPVVAAASVATAVPAATAGHSTGVREEIVPASDDIAERRDVVQSPTSSVCSNESALPAAVSNPSDASKSKQMDDLRFDHRSDTAVSENPPVADKSVESSSGNDAGCRSVSQAAVTGRPLRPGDTGIGRRPQPAIWKTPLTPEQAADIQRRRDARDRCDGEWQTVDLAPASTEEKFRRIFIGPTATLMLLGIVSLLGLFLYSQLLALISQLALLPHWARYLSGAALALMVAAVLVAGARLLWLYFRWQRVDQVSIRTLRELGERSALRRNAHIVAKQSEAIGQLRRYLETYVLPWENSSGWVSRIPPDQEFSQAFSAAQQRLLSPTHFANAEAWLNEFVRDVQSRLDNLAQARIEYHARRVAIKTALSPYAIADVLIAIYYGLVLMGDLCCIYNLRTGRLGTARLLIRVFFNAYVAGRANELEPVAEGYFDDFLEERFSDADWLGDMGAKIGAKLTGKLSVRVASGTVNYFLFRKLGRAAIKLLQPADPA